MINYAKKQGLERWANTDPAMHCNVPEPAQPDWRRDYIAKLQERDYEGAAEIRERAERGGYDAS